MTIHLTIQELLKQEPATYVDLNGRWLKWIEGERWVVKEWHNELSGTRRIRVLVRTEHEAEAVHVLMHGKTGSEEGK